MAVIAAATADLSLSKTVDDPTPRVGDGVVFTLTVSSAGPDAADGVEVTDRLPSGYSYVGDDSAGAYDPGTGVWTVGTLGTGGAATLNVTASVNAAGDYTNTAEITASSAIDPDSTPGNGVSGEDDQAEASAAPVDVADLSLAKAVDDPTPDVGQDVVFTLTVANEGPADATGVEVTDLLPPGYTYRADDGGGAYDPGTGVWTVGVVTAGGTATLNVTARVNSTDDHENVAEITAAVEVDPDSTPGNGATDEDDYAARGISLPNEVADLSLTKTVDDATPAVGQDVVFTLTVTNDGPASSVNSQVTDLLPSGYTYVGDDGGGAYDPGTGIWSLGTLPSPQSRSLNITARVNASGEYRNTAEVTRSSRRDPDSSPGNGVTTEDDWAGQATAPGGAGDLDVSVTKDDGVSVVRAGTETVYTITVVNHGPGDGQGTRLVDTFDPGDYEEVSWSCAIVAGDGDCTQPSGTGDIDTIVDLESPGTTAEFTVKALVATDATGTISNTASVRPPAGRTDSDPSNDSDTDVDSVLSGRSDLRVTKDDGLTMATPGTTITYVIEVTNDGPSKVFDGRVVDDFDPAFFDVPNVTWTCAITAGRGRCDPTGSGDIDTKVELVWASTATFTVDAPILPGATGTISNTVTVYAPAVSFDPFESNNSATDADTVLVPSADLRLSKTVDDPMPPVGGTVVFTLAVTNDGPSDATGVEVTDRLPSGFTYAGDDSGGAYDPGTGVWTVGALKSGTTRTLDLTVTVNATGNHENEAEVTASDQPDPDSTPDNDVDTEDDHAEQGVTPATTADLSLAKSVDDATPLVGTDVEFTLVVANDGPDPSTGGEVGDLLPSGYTYVSDDGGGAYDPGTGVWTFGGIPVAGSLSLRITATVNATGDFVNVAEITAADQSDPDSTPNDADPAEDDYAERSTTPSPSADLSLTKTVDDDTPDAGTNVTFTLTVSNAGPDATTGVEVTDLLPSGYTYASDDSGGVYDPGTGVWTVGALAVGASATLNVTATVEASGDHTNVAEVTASDLGDADSVPNNADPGEDDYAERAVAPNVAADLRLAKTVDDPAPVVGSDVVFTVTVTNDGPRSANGVRVRDLLPSGYAWVSDDSGGTYDPGTGRWTVGSLAAGASRSLAITAEVRPAGGYLNVAEVSASNQSDPDSTPDNGVTTEDDYAEQATAPTVGGAPSCNVAVDRDTFLELANPSDNHGTSDELENKNDPSDERRSLFHYDLDGIPSDATVTDATAWFYVTEPDLGGLPVEVYRVTDAWDEATATWANTSSDFDGSTVHATLSPTVANEFASADLTALVQSWVDGTFPNEGMMLVSASPADESKYRSKEWGLGAQHPCLEVTWTPPAEADLSLTKTVDDPAPDMLSNVVFTLTVDNAGPEGATGVEVTDQLPSGFFYVSDDGGGAYDPGTGVWSVGALAAGASATLDVTARVEPSGNYTNVAEVTASDVLDPDSVPGNGVTTEDDYAERSVTPNPVADLSLSKTVDDSTPDVGTNVVFTLTVTNAGPADASGVEVTDLLPSGYTHAGNDGGGSYDPAAGVWTVGALAAGASRTLNLTATVEPAGTYVNRAEITAASPADPDSTPGNDVAAEDDYAQRGTTPQPVSDLSLAMGVSDPTPDVGSSVVFTLTVDNAGPSTATGVDVTDALPSGYTYASDDSGGAYDPGTGVWTVGSLASGASSVLNVTATVNLVGEFTNSAEVTASGPKDPDSTPANGVTSEDDYAERATVPNTADLSLAKSVDDSAPDVGATVVFTLSVDNAGPVDATGVEVTDPLPSGYTYVADDAGGAYDPGTGVWAAGTVAAGGSATLNLSASVDASGNYTNAAEVTASALPDPDSTPGNGLDSEDDWAEQAVSPEAVADLSLAKSVDDATPDVGTDVAFTLTVSNTGPSDATGVEVTDLLPSGYAYAGHAGDGAYDPGTGAWSVGGLAAGASAALSLTATVQPSGDYANVAEITAAIERDPDSTPANGVPGEDDHAERSTVPNPVADLSLAKTVDDPAPDVGATVVFTLTLDNAGPSDAAGVEVTDALPSGFTYVFDDGGGAYDPGTGLWSVGGLAAGGSASLSLTATVDPTGDYTNVAEVTASPAVDPDSTPGNGAAGEDDHAERSVDPNAVADLSLTKTVDDPAPDVGATVVFTLTVDNAGPSDATGVEVTDTLPSGFAYVADDGGGAYDAGTGLWSVGGLAAGASATLSVTATVNPTGGYVNVAEITAGGEPDPDSAPANGDTGEDDYAERAVTPNAVADLSLTKTVSDSTPDVGTNVVFTVTVSNAGPSAADGVEVTDSLPGGFTHVSDDSAGAYDPGTGVWTVGSLDPGLSATLNLTVSVNPSGGYTNACEVTAANQSDPDSTPANGDAGEDDYAERSVAPNAVADLSIDKTVDDGTPEFGGSVTFTLTVTNAGPSDATGVSVTDLLPSGFTYVSDDGGGAYDPATGAWNVGSVAAGGSATLDISVTVDVTGNHTNAASIASMNETDPDSSNDADQLTLLPGAAMLTSVSKVANKSEAGLGEVVAYTVTLRNLQDTDLDEVRIADRIPPNFKYVRASARLDGAPMASEPGGPRPLVFEIGTLAATTDPGEPTTVVLSYQLVVGAGATPGTYENTAFARTCETCVISGVASAEVEIRPDPVFDLATIIGKVWEDRDHDGRQDPGEPGVADAMVALDDGTYALTDDLGRYHFPAVDPGHRMVKINRFSLPAGVDTTTDESRILWITPGLLARANFGVVLRSDPATLGAPEVRGLALSGRVEKKPPEVVGNTETQSLVVNGTGIELPGSDVRLRPRRVDDIVRIVGDRLSEPVRFDVEAPAGPGVEHWALTIRDARSALVRRFEGAGAVPSSLAWDGRTADGSLISAGQTYLYRLDVAYADGTRTTSARRIFGVNRKMVLSLELTGNAFEVDSATLSPGAEKILEEAASILVEFPDEQLVIEGHTDSTGSDDHNLELSRQRAQAAYDHLTRDLDFPAERVVLRWFGEDRPLAPNELAEGRELNRRVELKAAVEEVESTSVLDQYRTAPRVRINGAEVPVGERGRFRARGDDPEVERLDVEMTGSTGRQVRASFDLPALEIVDPTGERLVAYGESAHGCTASLPEHDASVPAVVCTLVGRTDPGRAVELAGRSLAVEDDGAFRAPLGLRPGLNTFGLVARDASGLTRIANLEVAVSERDPEGHYHVVADAVPTLTVDLPPEGARLRSTQLALRGTTEPDNRLRANGREIPVRPDGRFAASVDLAKGRSRLTLEVVDPEGRSGKVERLFHVVENELFLLAFADGKFGRLQTDGFIEGAGEDESSRFYSEGRLAFYLKGKIKGKYLVTSALDTGRNEVGDLFRDFNDSDTRRLLTNLDPDRFYPVYGDSGTVVYDVESRGKFYLALESDEIDAVIGNYPLSLTDTELAAYQRTLYGGRFAYKSASKTRFGDPDTLVVLFFADVRNVHVRDELRATGGSLYYLSHDDVVHGSEEITLVVRDKNTGLVLSRHRQRQNVDYTVKYPEGRVMFHRPISSVAVDGSLVDRDVLGGHPVFIQADYETRLRQFEKTSSGARFRRQLGDRFAIGGTYVDDEMRDGTYELTGVDTEIRLGENSRIRAEYAETTGTDSLTFVSDDGGLSYTAVPTTGLEQGEAWKASAELDVGEWFGRPDRYEIGAYVKELDPGFFSSGNFLEQGTKKSGFNARFELTDRDTLLMRHDREDRTGTLAPGAAAETTLGSVLWKHARARWGLDVELFSEDADDEAGEEVKSDSLGAARFWSKLGDKLTTRVEHQHTLSGTDNDRTSVGLEYQALPSLSLGLQGTDGSRGSSAQVGASLDLGDTEIYLTERLSDDSAGEKTTTILGARSPLGPASKVYTEYRWEDADDGERTASLLGLQRRWDPAPGFKFTLSGELSDVDSAAGETSRSAAGAHLSYSDGEDLTAFTRNEIRYESGAEDRTQLLTLSQIDYELSADLSLFGKYRYSRTRDRATDETEARIDERSIGLAFRPVRHDRFNALFRYTRLVDQRPSTPGSGPSLETLLDVLSAETVLQATERLEWVAKAAVRTVEEEFADLPPVESSSLLAIQRFNVNVWKRFDFGVEYRMLRQDETEDQRRGWLTEIMWNLMEHFRVGAGYNFTDFTDDEFSRNDYSVTGWFFRVQGRY